MSRRKPVDQSADFEQFIEQTSDYLPPSKNTQSNKHNSKQFNLNVSQNSLFFYKVGMNG